MKKLTFIKGVAILTVGFAVIGCGGGSDSSSSKKAALDAQSIDKLGTNAAKVIPGCVYTSETVATVLEQDRLASYKVVIDTIKSNKSSKSPKIQKDTINENAVGDCGGTYTISGEHDNGDTDVTYAFDNFCNGSTTIDGSAHVYIDGTPSDDGPITESIEVSTGSSGVAVTTTVDGTTTQQSIYIDDFKWTATGSMSVDELKTTSAEGTYSLTNVDIVYNETAETVQIKSATYTDPEVGAVTVSTTVIPTADNATGPATLTVTGSDGTATFTTNDVSTGLFTSSLADGTTVVGLDCSGLASE
ncbi:MAG: hypothetical protein K0U38_02995 [Epsilonproteobacteria bacterium]|nr:hypothetical protein [Campylobacterota bacterium]